MTLVSLAPLCLTHGKHLGSYETSCSLLEILTLNLSLHPKNAELTHLQAVAGIGGERSGRRPAGGDRGHSEEGATRSV